MAKKKTISPKTYAYEIVDVEIENHQASGETVTAVTIHILKDDEVVGVRRLGFKSDMSKEDIISDITKVVEALANDNRIATESAKVEAQTAEANALKESLLGQVVEVETNSQTDESTDEKTGEE